MRWHGRDHRVAQDLEHHGSVDLAVGKGSEFIVRFTIPMGTDVPEPPPVAGEKARRPGRRVLVVDDNTDAMESLARYLRCMGHEVRTAHGGAEAVVSVPGFLPEVILMDIGMPNMDAYEAARLIRTGTGGGDPFIVALTGSGADDDRRWTHDAGFDRHLVKPVDPEALTGMISEMPIGQTWARRTRPRGTPQ